MNVRNINYLVSESADLLHDVSLGLAGSLQTLLDLLNDVGGCLLDAVEGLLGRVGLDDSMGTKELLNDAVQVALTNAELETIMKLN